MTPTPRMQARAFAIWRYAEPRDWNVTYEEIAEATGLTVNQVKVVFRAMGWFGRINRSRSNVIGGLAIAESGQNYQIPSLIKIFRNTDLTSAQEFVNDWG